MAAHTQEQFDLFISQLRETNATLDFYCDFPKIAKNVAKIEISLNTLNYLIGKEDLRSAVQALWALVISIKSPPSLNINNIAGTVSPP